MKRHPPTPLFEEAEGREADDRASLFAAWKRSNDNTARRPVTNLHVREFLLYVFATDRDGRGVKMTYEEIAMRLECTKSTARSVVDRAANEYGLLAVREDRYVDGGQTANRYAIDWQMVRSINAGIVGPSSRGPGVVSRQPPAVRAQPRAVTQQGAAVTAHPYKETPEPLPELLPEHLPLTEADRGDGNIPGEIPGSWEVVVSALVDLGMGGASRAVDAAKRRSLTPEDVSDLVERWERLRARQPHVTVAWLYRWVTGASRPPADDEIRRAGMPRGSLTSETTRKEVIRARVIKEGRRRKASPEQVSAALESALQQAGFSPDAVTL
ncbi:hypothetical protein [Rhodopirellula bahusiensis]|uniref:hypothetical protein n=1 Tax=Rhodopirellula bahusiensis TaxID=2014065 RepID=UPI00326717A1